MRHPSGHGTWALKRARALACLIPLLLCVPHALPAQAKPRVLLDALLGFNGLAREGRFAPLIVSVSTPGSKLSGEVQVDVLWGSALRGTQESRTYVRSDTFAAGGVRRLPFIVPIPSEARTLAVSVRSGGATVAETSIDLRAATTQDRIIAGVSSTLSLDALADLGETAGSVRVAYPRVDDLPDAWGGYDGLDLVVVHDTYFRQLRDAQVAALERWVIAGGTVVFTGGAAGLQHEGAGFGRLLPVEITGLREVASIPVLAGLAGVDAGPRGRIPVAEARVTSGTALASQDGLPLVVRRDLGRGVVWFLAVDPTLPPFTTWPGTLRLWQLVDGRDRSPVLSYGAREPAEDPWMSILLASPPLAFPSAYIVLAFCAGYLGLLLAVVLGGRRVKMGPGLRAVLLVALPLAASATGWFLFNTFLFRAAPLLLDASVAQMRSGDGQAFVTEKVGLFASRPTASGLVFDSSDVLLDELVPSTARGQRPPDAGIVLAAGARTLVHDMPMGRYGSRLLSATGVVPFPITIEAADPTALTVVNSSAAWLRDSFFWRKGRAWLVGDIAPGTTRSLAIASDDGIDPRTDGAPRRINGSDQRVNFWSLVSGETDSGPGVLVCWLDDPALRLTSSNAMRSAERPTLSLLLVGAP